MILSHIPLTSLNMSSYRPIWTHFRPNFICFEQQISYPGFTMGSWIHNGFLDSRWIPRFGMDFGKPHASDYLAVDTIFSLTNVPHISASPSRLTNVTLSQAVFSSEKWPPDCWKPLSSDWRVQGSFFSGKMAPRLPVVGTAISGELAASLPLPALRRRLQSALILGHLASS